MNNRAGEILALAVCLALAAVLWWIVLRTDGAGAGYVIWQRQTEGRLFAPAKRTMPSTNKTIRTKIKLRKK